MSERISIGIDSGVKGGCVVILPDNTITYTGFAKLNRYEIRNWIEGIDPSSKHVEDCSIHACIEKVGGFIGDGEKNVASAHTTFVLGRSYGNLEMALVCARISFTEVLPREWQSKYGMKRDKGESKPKWKGRLATKAHELFPDVEFNKELADAFLIAHYCRSLKTW